MTLDSFAGVICEVTVYFVGVATTVYLITEVTCYWNIMFGHTCPVPKFDVIYWVKRTVHSVTKLPGQQATCFDH